MLVAILMSTFGRHSATSWNVASSISDAVIRNVFRLNLEQKGVPGIFPGVCVCVCVCEGGGVKATGA